MDYETSPQVDDFAVVSARKNKNTFTVYVGHPAALCRPVDAWRWLGGITNTNCGANRES